MKDTTRENAHLTGFGDLARYAELTGDRALASSAQHRAAREVVTECVCGHYDGRAPKLARVRWQVTGTGWYWDDFTVSASSMPEALAKAEDILKNREGIAQITSITREGSK